MVVFRNLRELDDEISRRRKEAEKLPVGSEEWLNYCNGTAKLMDCRRYFMVSPDTKAKIAFGTGAVLWMSWYQKNNILDLKPIRALKDIWVNIW